MSRTPSVLAGALLAALAACSPRPDVGTVPAPAAPEATVRQFLADANDLNRMAQLWGAEDGPSSVRMRNVARRDSVMTILQHLLVADSAHVIGTEPVPGHPSRRLLRMELFQGERRVTVPFTLAPQREGGWLVMQFDPQPLMPTANPRARP
jgi:hypothetical protein